MNFVKAFTFSALVIVGAVFLGSVWFDSATAVAATDSNSDVGSQITGEVVTRAPSSLQGPRNGVSRKRYPGGADEDDLQVLATLPIPSRTFDGAATNSAVESGTAEAAPSPATD